MTKELEMKPKTAIWLWAATILFVTLFTIFDLLAADRWASIIPLMVVGATMHIHALRLRQGATVDGSGC
jgi:hypothetical protein